jgi:hypothetical protein
MNNKTIKKKKKEVFISLKHVRILLKAQSGI